MNPPRLRLWHESTQWCRTPRAGPFGLRARRSDRGAYQGLPPTHPIKKLAMVVTSGRWFRTVGEQGLQGVKYDRLDQVGVKTGVHGAAAGSGRQLVRLRWGLVPFWSKDPSIVNKLINARAICVHGGGTIGPPRRHSCFSQGTITRHKYT